MPDITGLPKKLLLDPEFLGSLQNTLTSSGVMSQMEAAFKEVQDAAAKHTADAASAASQAGDQYTQAAAAPPADVDPLGALIRSSLGNTASVISGNKAYSERGREDIQNERRTLMQARMDNLNALKTNYEKKAAALEAAGHDEEALKTRLSIEKVSKQYDLMTKDQDHTFAIQAAKDRLKGEKDLIAARGVEERRTNAAKPTTNARTGVTDPNDYALAADAIEKGQAKMTEFPFAARIPIMRIIAERGGTILSQKVRDTINSVSAARGIVDQIESLAQEVNTSGSGAGRITSGIKSTVRGWLQSDAANALYDKTREGFLATISRATGERGVLTDRDAYRAKQLLPTRFDSRKTAQNKIAQLKEFFDGIERRALANYTQIPQVLGSRDGAAPVGGGDPLGIRGGN